jgi:hypothetical protein
MITGVTYLFLFEKQARVCYTILAVSVIQNILKRRFPTIHF